MRDALQSYMNQMIKNTLWALTFILGLQGIALSSAQGAADKSVVLSLQKLLEEEDLARTKLDTRLTDAIKDLQAINASQNNGDLLESSLLRAESKISEDKAALAENHLRIEFLNMFISLLEPVADVRAETSKILAELSHKELLASVESGNENKVWLFELYLSIAIRDIMEPSENYADFVKKFMNYASLSEPRSPAGFMKGKDRKYLSGPEKPTRGSPTQD